MERDYPALNRDNFDAVLLDLDGVITDTARIHARCWKKLFDAYLKERARETGGPFEPFAIDPDYYLYVDGKPRHDGVRDFLASRNISLPEGSHLDPPGSDTVCALGNRKSGLFNEVLNESGVEAYEGTVALVRRLRDEGIRTGVVSSSNSCAAVLASAGIAELFDTRVDGVDILEMGLEGKPAPDCFEEGARRLGVAPRRTAVIEDAISGVQAGKAGGFALIIGVDRKGDADALKNHGADIVVSDLAELL
jgi:alpha,alpha-trehalase